jgi:Ca-activated chloride channel family protein
MLMRISARVLMVGLSIAMLVVLPDATVRATAQVAQSKATVIGSVVDGSLNPLAGVTVIIERAGQQVAKAVTGADGKFRFADLPAGDYQVRAERTGLPAFTRAFRVPAGATSLQLPIVLARPEEKNADEIQRTGQQGQRGASGGVAQTLPAVPTPPPATATAAGAGAAGGRGGGVGVAQRGSTIAGLPQSEVSAYIDYTRPYAGPGGGESYASIDPNRFKSAREHPLSTFGADVDTASYANVRRFLSQGQLPPRDAVRVEEFINYFRFNYPAPRDGRPIALTTEIGDCPWAPAHKLVLIGARAAAAVPRETGGRNIVLLIDVSGSMAPPERLPMIKSALGMFVDTLRADDTISIVTYAGTSGVALEPTPIRERDRVQRAISYLNANGSTNGAQGLITAYRIARQAYVPGGVNRVILATDGDFNVGITSQGELLRLIERERESGVFLSVFGVGSGNLKDSTMEMLADKGNGHYSYLDSIQEARRMLVREADATLETVAKDVKFQVEFNPAVISAWKLIGYENRALAARDFNNDRKDAGEMGAGHSVTVLYEVIPAGVDDVEIADDRPEVDPLRYQTPASRPAPPAQPRPAGGNGEWLTVKARYKQPEGERSDLIAMAVQFRANGRNQYLPLAATVAEFGLLLRDAPHQSERWTALERRAELLAVPSAQSADVNGFKELVATARALARNRR